MDVSSARFDGQLVQIFGGAGGIGSAATTWFGVRGADVVVCDLPSATLHAAGERAGVVRTVAVDVADEASVTEAFASMQDLAPPGVVVNAAGVTGGGPLESMPLADWQRVLDVNLTGVFLVLRSAIPLMRASGVGKIVNLSSVNARTGGGELSGAAYAVAKSGVEAITRHLARALAPHIQVNAVAPGPVRTPMLDRLDDEQLAGLVAGIPAGRIAEPEEIAEVIGFLASPASDFITGTTLQQNGGQWVG